MSSLFDNSIIKRIDIGGYVNKERYEIILHNGSVIIVSDKYEMDKLRDIIKEVRNLTNKYDIHDQYYEILTNRLIEEGW